MCPRTICGFGAESSFGMRHAMSRRFRELIISLAERDYRARYKQAFLGIVWSVLNPVMLMLGFAFVSTRSGALAR